MRHSATPVWSDGRRAVGFSLLLAVSAACATSPRAAPTATADAPLRPSALRTELDAIFGAPEFAHARWGVVVQSADTGRFLYSLNPSKLMLPASNMKLVTLAVAAQRLGWDYQFETTLATDAPVEDGVLKGDLVVIGSGDPTINGRDGRPAASVFDAWAETLRSAGITAIDGDLVGDDDAFDDVRWGPGWEWDDLAYAYAAPGGALQFNENMVTLSIEPGPIEGSPAVTRLDPSTSDLVLVNQVQTGPAGGQPSVSLTRLPGQTVLTVTGSVPAGGTSYSVRTAVDNPTLVFVQALKASLHAHGIAVRGEAVDIDDLADETRERITSGSRGPGHRVLATYRSPPLADVAQTMVKASVNLYADTLFEVMGTREGIASMASGRAAVEETLGLWEIPPTGYAVVDGSGLSRLTYLSASTIAAVLRRIYRDEASRGRFLATLPIAGEDGTLDGRMRNTRAAGNVRAKTGTLSHVRSLSGYVTTRDGEMLVFSILANDFTPPTSAVDAAIDLAVGRLANLTRR